MAKDQVIYHDRYHRIDKRQRSNNRGGEFLNRAIEQLVHNAGVHDAEGQQDPPGELAGENRHVRQRQQLDELLDGLAEYAQSNTAIVKSSPVKRRLPPI